MRAAVLSEYTTPRYGTFEEPEPAAGQSLVEVLAAGVNPIDVLSASGRVPTMRARLPVVAGREGVGTIGSRRVYFEAVPPFGSMAERALAPTAEVFDVPDELSDGIAVALGIAGLAAWIGFDLLGDDLADRFRDVAEPASVARVAARGSTSSSRRSTSRWTGEIEYRSARKESVAACTRNADLAAELLSVYTSQPALGSPRRRVLRDPVMTLRAEAR